MLLWNLFRDYFTGEANEDSSEKDQSICSGLKFRIGQLSVILYDLSHRACVGREEKYPQGSGRRLVYAYGVITSYRRI